ncbi:DUF4340 domain-containing protein [Anabaena sp. CS-542/02]|uniref:DUF4340 domain-containing protein n=1 Tax=Anabaena sp. CS-542/02 TaxID=3021719 RepID=UPI00232FD6B3|nr:DUF4340 domain-containing protein [Anabaena sp. CS-542/02]MDB9445214.1 DUF4340 domain-containing protein [Anabaena sp. CS-542/02]
MKLPRTTLVLMFLAVGLGGFVYFYEIKGTTEREQLQAQKQQIFTFTRDDIQSLTIQKQDITVSLERNTPSTQPQWLLTSPSIEPANDAIVAYLTNLLVNGESDRTLEVTPNQLEEFGFSQPLATINIKLKNQKTHELILGNPDFNSRFLYAQTDENQEENGKINVILVSTDFENAVNRELSEWQQPKDNSEAETNPEDEPIKN